MGRLSTTECTYLLISILLLDLCLLCRFLI